MLPPVDPVTGLLPSATDPYPATMEEVHERFVTGAPFETERQLVFDALSLYASLIWGYIPDATLRINGGFVTHKQWAAPQDVDIAVVCRTITPTQLNQVVTAPLFTLLNSTGMLVGAQVNLPKAHVMGGLVDAFPVLPNLPHAEALFRRLWSGVLDENRELIPGLTKGYVEVSNPNVS